MLLCLLNPAHIEALAGPILRGELIWCQLFSEPDAGSDVASLTLRAVQTDGGWVLRGQKIWTTQAHLADMGLCLARTGTADSKHRGLSMFLIDMKSPQLDIRPIRQANGAAEFNEVFFNDAFVPDSMLLGQPGQGWALTLDTLAQERLFIGTCRDTGNEQRIRRIITDNQYTGSRDERPPGAGPHQRPWRSHRSDEPARDTAPLTRTQPRPGYQHRQSRGRHAARRRRRSRAESHRACRCPQRNTSRTSVSRTRYPHLGDRRRHFGNPTEHHRLLRPRPTPTLRAHDFPIKDNGNAAAVCSKCAGHQGGPGPVVRLIQVADRCAEPPFGTR